MFNKFLSGSNYQSQRFITNFASTLANLFNVLIEFEVFFLGDFEEFKRSLLNPLHSTLREK
jgi:hypothetical protein